MLVGRLRHLHPVAGYLSDREWATVLLGGRWLGFRACVDGLAEIGGAEHFEMRLDRVLRDNERGVERSRGLSHKTAAEYEGDSIASRQH